VKRVPKCPETYTKTLFSSGICFLYHPLIQSCSTAATIWGG
jgi:hypothetical protein